jgi:hypothetical protein
MDDTLAHLVPQPARRVITLRREYLAAFDELVAHVRRELRIFDPDLGQLELNAAERVESLRRYLTANRDNRLYVAVHDPDHLTRSVPRMMELLAELGANIAVHRTEADAARAQDCFVLFDAQHVIRRPVAAQSRGVVLTDDQKEAHAMRERFDEIWQSSVPAVSGTKLGL